MISGTSKHTKDHQRFKNITLHNFTILGWNTALLEIIKIIQDQWKNHDSDGLWRKIDKSCHCNLTLLSSLRVFPTSRAICFLYRGELFPHFSRCRLAADVDHLWVDMHAMALKLSVMLQLPLLSVVPSGTLAFFQLRKHSSLPWNLVARFERIHWHSWHNY